MTTTYCISKMELKTMSPEKIEFFTGACSSSSSSTTSGCLDVETRKERPAATGGDVLGKMSNFKGGLPVDLTFESLEYTVSKGFLKDILSRVIGEKTVLHNVSGKFPANSLVAIMGPSGAGKSSLLDLLSGYRINDIKGKVLVNGNVRNMENFRRISCYIQQDDRIQSLLTVQENMTTAAHLKLGWNFSAKQKHALINEILTGLGLSEHINTAGSQLSGGQKKRLSIALELINNPSVMFLDEPTTGLDSSSCTQCISLLQMLAHQGRTIICTIHQPSATMFQMFDQVYLLAEGKCLYQGATDNLLEYLKTLQLPCPKYHNPADYIIELACGEYGDDKIDILVRGIDNGRNSEWFGNSNADDAQFLPVYKDAAKNATTMTPAYYQLTILLRRGFIKLKRDPTLTHMRIIVNFVVSIMFGILYINSGEDADKVYDNYNMIFTVIMHHVMSSMMLNIISFPMEMNIVLKEHFNRWYSLKMYYLSNNILDIPVTAFSCIMFSVIIYYMTNQLFEWYRYGLFIGVSLALVFIAQSLGYIFGTLFDVVNGTFAGPIFLVPMMMFSGFGVNLRDIPGYLKWGTHISFFRYALEGYVEAVFGGNRKPFTCYITYCHHQYPEKILEEIAMTDVDVEFSILMLIFTVLFTRILGYFVLSFRVRFGR